MNASRPALAIVFHVALLLAGCPSAPQPAMRAGNSAAKAAQPLTLLVVDDPELGQAIARQWRSRTEQDLNVRSATAAEIAGASRLPCDAVIFPAGLIGQMAERNLIVAIESAALADAEFNLRDIFDQIRLREMKWGNRTLAVPLGSPQLLLAYRADVFASMGLAPPADWPAYQQVAERLADRAALGDLAPPADQPWRSAVEPLAEGYAGQLLLSRAAPYALHREQVSPLFRFDSMQPLLDHPPYVKALEELAAAAKTGAFAEQRFSPLETLAELRAGRCAMALGWPAPEAPANAAKTSDKSVGVSFALLPGSPRAFSFAKKRWEERGGEDSPQVPLLAISGRMAGVSASAADPRRAEGFVLWLAGREMSEQVGPQSSATTLFRSSQIANSGRWTGSLPAAASRQYAETLAQTLSLPRAFPGLTLPGRLDYLAALDRAVLDAVQGKASAREALQSAAAKWDEITGRLGADAQRQANARSLGQAD